MQTRPKALLKVAGVFLLISALGFIGYWGCWIYLLVKDGRPCEHRSRIVSRNLQGDRVEFSEDFCGGPAFSSAGTLSLVSEAHAPQPFFSYQENGGDPVVSWTANDQLAVKIDSLEQIYVRKPVIGGVRVQYEIGEISVNGRR